MNPWRCGRRASGLHVNSKGEVDYLEVRPAANGAAADRFHRDELDRGTLSAGRTDAFGTISPGRWRHHRLAHRRPRFFATSD